LAVRFAIAVSAFSSISVPQGRVRREEENAQDIELPLLKLLPTLEARKTLAMVLSYNLPIATRHRPSLNRLLTLPTLRQEPVCEAGAAKGLTVAGELRVGTGEEWAATGCAGFGGGGGSGFRGGRGASGGAGPGGDGAEVGNGAGGREVHRWWRHLCSEGGSRAGSGHARGSARFGRCHRILPLVVCASTVPPPRVLLVVQQPLRSSSSSPSCTTVSLL
jgi:hypothetical protein